MGLISDIVSSNKFASVSTKGYVCPVTYSYIEINLIDKVVPVCFWATVDLHVFTTVCGLNPTHLTSGLTYCI